MAANIPANEEQIGVRFSILVAQDESLSSVADSVLQGIPNPQPGTARRLRCRWRMGISVGAYQTQPIH
jgi:hypothetical protein